MGLLVHTGGTQLCCAHRQASCENPSGKDNKQDAYRGKDVALTEVTFRAYATAPAEQLDFYGYNADASGAPGRPYDQDYARSTDMP